MNLPSTSLRQRFLLVVTGVVVVPLALVGFWLTGSASRSGKDLLRARLDAGLAPMVAEAGVRWLDLRGELLDIAEDPAVRAKLLATTSLVAGSETRDAAMLNAATSDLGILADALSAPITLRSAARNGAWVLDSSDSAKGWVFEPTSPGATAFAGSGISVSLPVFGSVNGAAIGRIESQVTFESIVPTGSNVGGAAGAVLLMTDRASGSSLSALQIDPALMANDEFELAGERWIVRRRTLEEPAIVLALAAPLAAYSLPFEQAARKGSIAIIAVALGTLVVASLLTRRITRSLVELAIATNAVAQGDLDRQVSERHNDEVGRVGRAFNAMTESLRVTLRRLAQREALAAVGEFAASLSHEVRNPLTSIRIDLQRVEEKLPVDSPLHQPLSRALREVRRLDETVSGSLRIARSGQIKSAIVDLHVPLRRAIEVSAHVFDLRGASVAEVPGGPASVIVRGDESALEQLFLNLLLNAAEAAGRGGRADVSVHTDGPRALVAFRDSGPGIPPADLAKVFEPFYSTKQDGTGLGLSVARQIVTAHGGTIEITSTENSGTTVTVCLYLHG